MNVRQEPDSLRLRPIVVTAAITVLVSAIGIFVARELQNRTHRQKGGEPFTGNAQDAPAESPSPNNIEMTFFDRHAPSPPQPPVAPEMDSYAWIDQERGIVQIPIARAIDLYLERQQAQSQAAPHKKGSTP